MDVLLNCRFFVFWLFTLAHTSQSFGQINSFYKFNEEIDSLFLDKEQYSFAAWNYSFIGEYQKALEAYDKTSRKDNHSISDKEVALLLSDYKARPAAEYIIERSKNERIIIINEAHHQPLHRVLQRRFYKVYMKVAFGIWAWKRWQRIPCLTSANGRK